MLRAIFVAKRYLGAFIFFSGVLVGSAGVAVAQTVLTLENPSEGIVIEMGMEDLLAMPQVTVNTANDFVDDVSEFSGPLARDVVSMLGDDIKMARFYAINGYSIEIPVSDFRDYDVIFALSIDGKLFSLRDKGPVWLIYPMTDNPELQDRVYNDRLIWLLTRVTAL